MRIEKRVFSALILFSCVAGADADRDRLLQEAINQVFPGREISRIKPAPVRGLYEVLLGTEVLYVSEEGRYILSGDLIDLNERLNLSEEQRAAARAEVLEHIPVTETIDFLPAATKHTVYVFTDITCGYCRQFHRDVPALNDRGVAVRYLAFPRAGIDSEPFRDMESVWCAADRNTAITRAKLGDNIAAAECDNPVKRQYELGKALGVRGTPAIYLDNGQAMPGYVPPDELLQAFGAHRG